MKLTKVVKDRAGSLVLMLTKADDIPAINSRFGIAVKEGTVLEIEITNVTNDTTKDNQ